MPGMSALIDAAVAKKPSGLVVSIPNPDALSPSISKAIAAGIPVVSMNSGSDVFKGLGNQALTLRCNGLFQGMGLTDPSQGKVLTGKISDPTGMQATIAAAIQADPT